MQYTVYVKEQNVHSFIINSFIHLPEMNEHSYNVINMSDYVSFNSILWWNCWWWEWHFKHLQWENVQYLYNRYINGLHLFYYLFNFYSVKHGNWYDFFYNICHPCTILQSQDTVIYSRLILIYSLRVLCSGVYISCFFYHNSCNYIAFLHGWNTL